MNGFKKFQRCRVKELLLYNRIWIMWNSIQVLPNQVSKKSFYTFEDIDLRESHAKLHKKPSETLGADLKVRNQYLLYMFSSEL